jgi:hypothetical protein
MSRKNESAHAGQTIRTEGMPDRSSHDVKEAISGRKMGGGPTNLEHSNKPGFYNSKDLPPKLRKGAS